MAKTNSLPPASVEAPHITSVEAGVEIRAIRNHYSARRQRALRLLARFKYNSALQYRVTRPIQNGIERATDLWLRALEKREERALQATLSKLQNETWEEIEQRWGEDRRWSM